MPRLLRRPLPPAHRPRLRWLTLAVLLWTFASPGVALGHAELVTADPLPNASVIEAPERVRITFSEPIDPRTSSIEVLDPLQRVVDGVGPIALDAAGTGATVGLPELQDGVYTVAYSVVSTVDGHATDGRFAFVVDPTGAQAPPTGPPATSSPSVDEWAIAARWVALIGALVALGSLVTWWHSGRPTLERLAPTADRRPPWRLVVSGAVLTLIGLTLYLALSARPLENAGGAWAWADPAAAFGWTPFAIAMRVSIGAGLLAAIVGVVALAWRRPADGDGRAPALVAAAALGVTLAGMSAAGHASALGGPPAAIIDWLHLVGAAAWLGGLAACYALGQRSAGLGEPVSETRRAIFRRHGRLALVAGPLVVLTGLANSPVVLGASRDLVASSYGNLLLAKATLASVALAIGAMNHFLVRGRGRGRLAALVGAELVVAAVAVMAAAAMVTVQPGAARQPVLTGPSVQPAHFFGEAGPTYVHVSASVPAPGNQTYQVTLRDAQEGTPRADIQKVFLTFTPPADTELARERVELEAHELGGLYTTRGAYTPVVGEWTLDVTVRRSGARDESVGFTMPVEEPSEPLLAPPPDSGAQVPGPLGALWDILPGGAAGWIPALVVVTALVVTGLRAPRGALGIARVGAFTLAVILVLGVGSRSVVEAANRPTAAELERYAPAGEGSVERGEAIYVANCASCHAVAGDGNGPTRTSPSAGPLSETIVGLSDPELAYRIANGMAGTPMPGFAASLTEEEIRDLIAYLRERWGSP